MCLVLCTAGLLFGSFGSRPSWSEVPKIQLKRETQPDSKAHFEITGLSPSLLKKLSAANLQRDEWSKVFAVYAIADNGNKATDRPAMLGTYSLVEGTIRFEPMFPLVPGVRYRAVFDPSRLPFSTTPGETVEKEFRIPRPSSAATTIVQQVYPTCSRVPENLLKFYLHFSGAMRRGEAYRHIHLFDGSGNKIEFPFLELDEELWDPESRRFTLFFDPGRIKRGVTPHEEIGPAIQEGKTYVLVIDRDWPDAVGNPLRREYQKRFVVGPPDHQQPDPSAWKISVPLAGTRRPIIVTLPESLDHALLQRTIIVKDPTGKMLQGQVSIEADETRWCFRPAHPWKAGIHELSIESTLEDLAGNSVERPFEVDVFRSIQKRVETPTVSLRFEIRAGRAGG